MKNLTTSLNIIPLRSDPSHRSEQVTQVLFGEQLLSLIEEKEFIKVQMRETGYEGWAQASQLVSVDNSTSYNTPYIVGLSPILANNGKQRVRLYHTTPLYGRRITLGGRYYDIDGEFRKPSLGDFVSEFPKLIEYYLRTPYLWGGRSSAGIDCSGLSQAVLAHFGIRLKRDAYQQAESGELVSLWGEVKAGDLAFFDNEQGRITHVGIMIDSETIIHASGEVRIDSIDQKGIYHADLQKYTHPLRFIKRYF